MAETHATGLADEDVREALFVQGVDECRERILRSGGDTARTHSDDNLHVLVGAVAHIHRLLLLLAHAAKIIKCQLGHFQFSLKYVSTLCAVLLDNLGDILRLELSVHFTIHHRSRCETAASDAADGLDGE